MTGFKGTRNVNGRPKGAVNKTTTNAKAVIQSLIDSEVKKIPELLDELSAKDRLEITIKLMNFVIPKQTQIEIEANDFGQCFDSEDQLEGMTAFLERREKNFKNK